MKRTLASAARPRFHGKALPRGAGFLADVVREIRAAEPLLTATDHNLLSDISRGQYSTAWLDRLLDIAARCSDDTAAYAPARAVRTEIGRRRSERHFSLIEAAQEETLAQGEADMAVLSAYERRSLAAAEAAIEKVDRHAIALSHMRDALVNVVARGAFS